MLFELPEPQSKFVATRLISCRSRYQRSNRIGIATSMSSLSLAFCLVWASFTWFEVSFSWCGGHVFLNLVVEQIVSSRVRPHPSFACPADEIIDCVAVREQATGMDMEDLVLDVLDTLGTAANPADTVELQLPQPSFDLRNILCRTRSLPAPMSEPGSFTVAVEDVEAQTNGGTATALGQGEENTSRSR